MPVANDIWQAISQIMQAGGGPATMAAGGTGETVSGLSSNPNGGAPWASVVYGPGTAFADVLPPVGGGPAVPPGAPYNGPNPPPPAPPGTPTGGGVYAPFGQNPGTDSDSPPAWLAKAALAAFQSGNTKYRDHLLADPTIANDPHLKNFIIGLFAGDADRFHEAQYYATNPSYNGWNNAAGDGIPGDGK